MKLGIQDKVIQKKTKEYNDISGVNVKLNEALMSKTKEYSKLNDGKYLSTEIWIR